MQMTLHISTIAGLLSQPQNWAESEGIAAFAGRFEAPTNIVVHVDLGSCSGNCYKRAPQNSIDAITAAVSRR